MLEVVRAACEYRKRGIDVILAGIVASTGSLPRRKGAYMLVGPEGLISGTIGGGNLEYNAIEYAKNFYSSNNNDLYSFMDYELNLNDSAKLGMVCGGSARVLFYRLSSGDDRLDSWLKEWETALCDGEDYELCFCEDENVIHRETIVGDGVVYIFGGGHLAREVVPVLSHLDFRVVVLDDRPEFADAAYFTGAREVRVVDFANLEGGIDIRRNDYVLVMTRGHEWDLYVESFALNTKASYIGVVGSRKKTAFVNEKLRAMGHSEESIKRIITPVGLDIGSETPAEIAISIAAQLIEVRADRRRAKA